MDEAYQGPQGKASQQSVHHCHHHVMRHRSPSSGEEGEGEDLDPRIQVELEKLNKASEEINKLELELDDARAAFRQVLSDSTQRLNGLAKKLGACVDKARPYYDGRMRLKEAHLESQKAALRFERACSMHEAAKEMVQLAEEGYKRREHDLDPTWQEMLNHATMKVNDAERERIESEASHQLTTFTFKKRDDEVNKLQRDLKRNITKSKPYFEMKAKFNQVMEDHKRSVGRLEDDVASAKALYSQALRSLEAISEDIHRQRVEKQQLKQLGVRGAGVGAEEPSPPHNIEGSADVFVFELDEKGAAVQGKSGIVRHDQQYHRLTSLADSNLAQEHLATDPLNLVVFKDSTSDTQVENSSLKNFEAPSVIHRDPDLARTDSYRAAIDGPQGLQRDSSPILASSIPALDHMTSDLAPSSSSLRRAQEWVNRSPVPQHRGFLKSRSLGGSLRMDEDSNTNETSQAKPQAQQTSEDQRQTVPVPMRQTSVPSLQTISTHSGSPSAARKSPKLQGLILKIDQPTTSRFIETGPKLVISTSRPAQGVFSEREISRSVSPVSEKFATTSHTKPRAGTFPAASMSDATATSSKYNSGRPKSGSSIPTSPPKPPSSLVSKLKQQATSLIPSHPTHPSPSTLSFSYQLPSANKKFSQCQTTGSLRHQLLSPSPSSPGTGDHFLMVGPRAERLLQVPGSENSSDTESIASTGPMLDDDQVEFLNMDFTEQSIGQDEPQEGEVEEPKVIHRGNWSRMSLPPRLSHLEGLLEAARHVSGGGEDNAQHLGGDDDHLGANDCDLGSDTICEGVMKSDVDQEKCGGDTSSVDAGNGGFEDREADFRDEQGCQVDDVMPEQSSGGGKTPKDEVEDSLCPPVVDLELCDNDKDAVSIEGNVNINVSIALEDNVTQCEVKEDIRVEAHLSVSDEGQIEVVTGNIAANEQEEENNLNRDENDSF